ncbi:MAG: hypothetical protein GX605_08395 [Chloroflexi bacterium]|nr:hypothetical protein [Chloroflexota bacterium]
MTVGIRRATPADYLAALRSRGPQGESGGLSLDCGYFLAEQDGHLVGCLGWRAENLVARLEDLRLAQTASALQNEALAALLGAVDAAAGELECEVALLALPAPDTEIMGPALQAQGYARVTPEDLPRHHREAAEEMTPQGQALWARRLRQTRVTRPL